uniref:Secreted protein n=1 Tax=Oryza punctata TaxID=4537 RepID=A0A0E0L596_ORYPU
MNLRSPSQQQHRCLLLLLPSVQVAAAGEEKCCCNAAASVGGGCRKAGEMKMMQISGDTWPKSLDYLTPDRCALDG